MLRDRLSWCQVLLVQVRSRRARYPLTAMATRVTTPLLLILTSTLTPRTIFECSAIYRLECSRLFELGKPRLFCWLVSEVFGFVHRGALFSNASPY